MSDNSSNINNNNNQADSGFNKENTSMNDQKDDDEDSSINECDEIEEDEEDDDNETDDDDDEDEETEEESSDSDQENQLDDYENDLKPPLSPNSIPTCYICLNEFEGQDVGSPDSCENFHHFCLECIEEWSKQINTCPVDRKLFSFIIVRREVNGEVIMKVPVKKSSVVEIETMDEDVTYCEICGRCDREDRLLLCDGCDFGYHCECLDPPLETIPVDEWFCPECFERLFSDDLRQESYMRQSTSQRRAIARTGAFEIVRNRILARRTTQQRNPTTTPKPRKRKTRRRRRKTRKTTKKTTTSTKKRKTRKRKSKKRTRKSKMSSRRLPSANQQIRNRIASKLGLGPKPKSPFGLPAMKTGISNKSISENRSSAGIGNLSMFGYELELNQPRSYDNDFEMDTSISESVGLLARARSHISPSFPSKSIKSPKVIFNMSSTNILSEIMTSQEILHASQSDLTISRNGVVYLKTDSKGSIRKCPDSNSQSSSSNGSPPQNSDGNGNNTNANTTNTGNNSFSNNSSYYNNEKLENLSESDISLIKPSPVVALPEDRPDIELYSDIESIGDNKEDNDDEDKSKEKKNMQDSNKNVQQKDENSKLDLIDSTQCSTFKEMDNTIDKMNESDNIGSEKLPKRRPSIKDLFGGDSDEEDDELKKLVAQQGSINVHYPIKMPIKLKTSFLNENKTNNYSQEVDEVPISKKWIPIYPETDKIKITGPKWKAIGFTAEKKSTQVIDDEESERNIQVEYSDKLVKDIQPKKCVTNDNAKKALKRPAREIDDEDLINDLIQIDLGVPKKTKFEVELKPSTYNETKAKVSSVTDSKTEFKKKVRVCKHGRVIVKDLDKKRSSPSAVVSNKKIKDNEDSYLQHDRHMTTKDQENDVNWKKLSSSSKMRNYRDGKSNEPRLLYMDRQLRATENAKIDKNFKDDESFHRDSKTRDRHRDRHRSDERIHDSVVLKSSSKSFHNSNNTKSSKSTDTKSREHERINSRRVTTVDELESKSAGLKESKSHKHRHHHKHKHNSENHHRHHSKKSSHVDKHHKHSSSTSNAKNDTSQKASYETYPVIKSLNSKEIYTEGDKIIINVNFNKEESVSKTLATDSKKKTEKNYNSDTERNSSNNNNNVEILSPQSADDNNYSNSFDHSDHSILSPIFNEEYSKSKMNENLKEVLSEEFKFLPKMIQTNNNHNSNHGPRTPDHYLDDSFLPTPTQDESQSPIISNRTSKQNRPSSIQSTSPIEAKDDFYDPELPLQSPDHNSIKSPSKDKFESATSPKESQMEKGDNASLTQSNMASTSSLASTVAKATATLASLNSFNLAQLIEIAKNFKNQNSDKNKQNQSFDNNRDIIEIVDMDVDSPSPNSSPPHHKSINQSSISNVKEIWDQIVKTASARLNNTSNNSNSNNTSNNFNNINSLAEQAKKYNHSMLDQPPTSAVDMEIKEKYIKKIHRQERVVEEVKLNLKPHYQKKRITKDEYKEILRKAVPKICHSKSGEINPQKIKKLVDAYIKRYRYIKKKDAQAGKL